MFGLPMALVLLIGLIVVIAVLFLLVKRPMYENMAVGFVLLVIVSGQLPKLGSFLVYPATSSLFYVIYAFMVIAVVFDATDAVTRIVRIMLALIGRFRGGAGYVATMASAFMAALSGSGPGNAAAIGSFTIPMMKRTGFRPHVAATVEMSASMLGNIIPPAGIIVLAFGVLDKVEPGRIGLSGWMIAAYAIGLWFLLQRFIVLFFVCRVTRVRPVPAAELPGLGPALRDGWPVIVLPIIMFLPLLLDAQAGGFLAARLGDAGADAFSDAVLMITPGVAAVYALIVGRRSLPDGRVRFGPVLDLVRSSLPKVVPIGAVVYFAYAISEVFAEMGADHDIQRWFTGMHLPVAALVIVVPVFFAILGMVLPGTAQVAILGGAVIAAFAAAGGDPILLAAMLPAMTGAMEGMTPPMALGLFVTMGIAGSDFAKTAKTALVWIGFHMLMSVVLLAGLLPITGIG